MSPPTASRSAVACVDGVSPSRCRRLMPTCGVLQPFRWWASTRKSRCGRGPRRPGRRDYGRPSSGPRRWGRTRVRAYACTSPDRSPTISTPRRPTPGPRPDGPAGSVPSPASEAFAHDRLPAHGVQMPAISPCRRVEFAESGPSGPCGSGDTLDLADTRLRPGTAIAFLRNRRLPASPIACSAHRYYNVTTSYDLARESR